MMKRPFNNFTRQHGFTLVEIMIAITLSLFLIGGLIQIYASSKKSALVQSELSRMQENQRFAIDYLNREIRMAGYFDQSKPTGIHPIQKFYIGTSTTDPLNTKDGGGSNSDVITISYESALDCLGNKVTQKGPNGETIAINKYYIQSETLLCKGNSNPVPQPIAEGILNMQVLYGENTDPMSFDQTPTANRYVRPEDADMRKVVSVRIALLFMTTGHIKTQDEKITHQLLDAPGIEYTDKRRREVVTTTIALRN